MLPSPSIIAPGTTSDVAAVRPKDVARAWRFVAWFGLILAIAGVGDWLIAWWPLRFGSAEWEFGTIVATFSGLPLVTMGFAGMLASAVARGIRWQILVVAWLMLLVAIFILSASIIFFLDVPVALRAVTGIARLGILKATAKTTLLGFLFFVAFAVGGIAALRYNRSRR
jgi:hypothetical protein